MRHQPSTNRLAAGRLPALFPVAGLLAALVLLAAATPAQEQIQADPGMVSIGKGVFKSYCTSCHGPAARGDGPLAEHLKVAPADLTALSRENGGEFPFDDVVKQIDGREKVRTHGSDMPVWGDVLQEAEGGGDPERVRRRIIALAYFIMSIQKAEAS